jgi:uncharacterized protein YodC (DUF2158 family)
MNEFKVGDTVQLKSGGPPMTITEVNDEEATCVWFDRGEGKANAFVMAALQPWKGQGPGAVLTTPPPVRTFKRGVSQPELQRRLSR